ncbi:enoyl-CoA hydratase/isomerase family protein [Demequina litorisediminis]|uniref:Enoyl-CoA hydratase/isomerase family protein n=1 Tax=Demequina litorisediminis TaxID=1849022 RepID=A0ABQ6IJU9_9MICO|nr:enoyl-CoA hydratase/isomerase family protein [Demequina litorisediminis]GMA37575.1 hypothetical protein GCM10025876_37790 [Demequina litorisediminis]
MPHGITLTIDGALAQVTLSRPERLNAIDFAMGAAYRDACLEATSTPSLGAVILDAEGGAFCAGGDVLAMASGGATGADVTAAARVIHEGISALTSSAIPVVAAVRGAVAGGGIGLMLAADVVVAAPDLRVAGRYTDVGLTPDLGVSTLLVRAVGPRRATAILTLGREARCADCPCVGPRRGSPRAARTACPRDCAGVARRRDRGLRTGKASHPGLRCASLRGQP